MGEWDLPKDVETQSIERVGGVFAWESGVYDTTVKMVYINQTKSEAQFFNVILEKNGGDMKELRENFCIKSGKAKGHKTYYVTKDGKKRPLPGYQIAESMCIAATGEDLDTCMKSLETKTVKVWDPEKKQEAPAERPVVMGLVGKPVKVAVHQVIEDRTTPNTKGEYVPTGEVRTVNQCKFFGNAEGKTAEEITRKETATMFTKWAGKNTGAVINKSTKGQSNNSAASIMDSTSTTETAGSLFDKEPPI
tara:strand:- start:54 stop:800 length:747 start_codon:yes stop_codon:yes gene_type:complete